MGKDNKFSRHLRRWELSALAALCAALCACTWAQGRQQSISASLVRLHVVAASDSQEEQALKLRVRDAVLDYLSPKLEGAESAEEAGEIISASIRGVARSAAAASEGRSVRVTLGEEYYPTRVYEGFTLPAGRYRSLRVILGEGEGHNWWCIVFPPVCLSAVQSEPVADAMAEEDFAIISDADGVELRFKLVELWGELREKLE